MTDEVFITEEDRLMSKRSTPIRQARIRELELRAMIEETLNPRGSFGEPAIGFDGYRYRPTR